MSETTSAIVATIDDAATSDSLANELVAMNSGRVAVYSSAKVNDFASGVAVIDALTNAVPLDDNIGKTINLVNVVIQPVEMLEQSTGVLKAQPRITLIDADGTSYHVISGVVHKDLKNFFAILGQPSVWPSPLPVQAYKESAKVGKFISLKIAKAPAAK